MPGNPFRRLTSIIGLSFEMEALTGLRVGAAESSIAIGGVDNTLVRDPLTSQPYVPGSSLKGKMRSLLERVHGLEQNQAIQRDRVLIHTCRREADYGDCIHCQLFGIPAPERERWFSLTRLRFTDLFLTEGSVQTMQAMTLELPFTEVKSEAAIDRVTSAAVPRSMERVPAGARFHGRGGSWGIGLMLYEGDDAAPFLDYLIQGLELVEADYLGSYGARGSGRVAFRELAAEAWRFPQGSPHTDKDRFDGTFADVPELRGRAAEVAAWSARTA